MITLEEAKSVVSAAERKAQEMDLAMNIAVMDAGRNLVAFHRMDAAWVASIDIAIDKAFTSAGRGLTTREIGELAQPGQRAGGVQDHPGHPLPDGLVDDLADQRGSFGHVGEQLAAHERGEPLGFHGS